VNFLGEDHKKKRGVKILDKINYISKKKDASTSIELLYLHTDIVL
jgi:hypothetical protein